MEGTGADSAPVPFVFILYVQKAACGALRLPYQVRLRSRGARSAAHSAAVFFNRYARIAPQNAFERSKSQSNIMEGTGADSAPVPFVFILYVQKAACGALRLPYQVRLRSRGARSAAHSAAVFFNRYARIAPQTAFERSKSQSNIMEGTGAVRHPCFFTV